MSGKSNVIYWLARHGIAETEEVVNRIFEAAKQSSRVLTDEEIHALCNCARRRRVTLFLTQPQLFRRRVDRMPCIRSMNVVQAFFQGSR